MPNLPTEEELLQQVDDLLMEIISPVIQAAALGLNVTEKAAEGTHKVAKFIHHYATKRDLELELKILKRIESMGDGEAHRQGNFSAHNMDDFHRAYGEIVAHNVHERIAELKAQKEQENK